MTKATMTLNLSEREMAVVEQIAAGLSDGARERLRMGRTDWRDSDWEDHCGDLNCDDCTGFTDTHINPNALSEQDKAVRAILKEQDDANT